jgi:phosphatidylglycerol:prolipoprotein diacylglycerol transferase
LYPFIHIGPLTLGTYGLMVAIGLICAFFILRADFARRGTTADAEAIIGITGLSGLAGSRLYHLLETPAEFFADPWPQLFSTMGFAFFGAVIGGFLALLYLARRFKIPALLMLDAASPAGALGYGIGRIGCLISGDGDYGIPTSLPWGMSFPNGIVPTTERVHPTPIYEFLVAVLIFWILWRLGARTLKTHAPNGYRTVSDRNHSHQSAIVPWAYQRAGRERRLGCCGRDSLHVCSPRIQNNVTDRASSMM